MTSEAVSLCGVRRIVAQEFLTVDWLETIPGEWELFEASD
jgi:hypothetical protein